jgi:hypothetical protein
MMQHTIIAFTHIRQFVGFTERVHKVGQACGIKVSWMIGQ